MLLGSNQSFHRLHTNKLIACFALVALADWLFYHHPIGWTVGFFELILLIVLNFFHPKIQATATGKILILSAVTLAASSFFSSSWLKIALFALNLATLLVLGKRGGLMGASVWLQDIAHLLQNIIVQWGQDIDLFRSMKRKKPSKKSDLPRLLWLALLPTVLSLSFVFLFAKANPMFAKLIPDTNINIGYLLNTLFGFLSLWRAFFWAVVGIVIWALLRGRFRVLKLRVTKNKVSMKLERLLNATSIVLSLAIFNLIFLVQNGLDIAFLWVGEALPDGLTYATYAHSGAYPLIVTALLAAAYVLLIFNEGHREYQTTLAKWLMFAWVGQNVFLVVSAIERNLYYIEAYSLTTLRFSALLWMALVAIGLLLIVLRIQLKRTNAWLINCNTIALLSVLYACCFLNFGALITRYNVQHSAAVTGEGTVLDINYIMSFGVTALPALQWYQNNAKLDDDQHRMIQEMIARLQYDLQGALESDWRGWTLEKVSLWRGVTQ